MGKRVSRGEQLQINVRSCPPHRSERLTDTVQRGIAEVGSRYPRSVRTCRRTVCIRTLYLFFGRHSVPGLHNRLFSPSPSPQRYAPFAFCLAIYFSTFFPLRLASNWAEYHPVQRNDRRCGCRDPKTVVVVFTRCNRCICTYATLTENITPIWTLRPILKDVYISGQSGIVYVSISGRFKLLWFYWSLFPCCVRMYTHSDALCLGIASNRPASPGVVTPANAEQCPTAGCNARSVKEEKERHAPLRRAMPARITLAWFVSRFCATMRHRPGHSRTV